MIEKEEHVMKISEMQRIAGDHSKSKGFHDAPATTGDLLMLVVTEAAEAMEDYRVGKMETYLDEKGKPCGFPSELADVVIRCGDMAYRYGIDLEAEVIKKMAYNATRSHMHGGKKV
jgi:NTP pyrophosphatase (non-canonical NTP hydrolase)